jgi:ribonuclease Z
MKITVLGTGHGSVTECYNTCFTISENDEHFLVDSGGGNGILKQLKDKNINLEQIKNIFISHTHVDHIVGVIWIIRRLVTRYYKKTYEEPTYIYGNDLVINAIKGMCNALLPDVFLNIIGDKIKLIEVKDNDTAKILNKSVTFFDINAVKIKQFGFYMDLGDNKKFTFIGDEVCSKNTEKYVQNSEWLFADAYMAGKEAEEYNPIERHHHSTVKFTSELAERLNVKNLILSHSTDKDLKNRKKEFIEDASKYFNGKVFAPDDLDEIEM